MLSPHLEARAEGLYAPSLDAFVDPAPPVARALITHAHSDHASPGHGEVWATPETQALYRRRHPDWNGTAVEIPYRTPVERGATTLTLLPAGHVLGSAQLHFRTAGKTLLYTGDFKRRSSRSAAAAEAVPADVLIIESTFGLPVFRFPSRGELEGLVLGACRRALDSGNTPILLAYALGKAQETAAILAEAGIPSVLHGAAWKLLPEFERGGLSLPLSRAYETGAPRPGEALIVPPSCARTPITRNIKARSIIYLSGWAIREASRADFDADVLIPFSDHADFPDLLRHVEDVGAERVVTMHGFAADFARLLGMRGREAWALSGGAERPAEDS